LRVLAECDPERPVAVCRELSKLHEEVRRGSAAELARRYAAAAKPARGAGKNAGRDQVRGEITLVIGAAAQPAGARAKALRALEELIAAGARARPAAAAVAKLTGVAANELYRAITSSAREPG
jgi:16S rRNA (cytidine1402-2'-O)-methyltransferase